METKFESPKLFYFLTENNVAADQLFENEEYVKAHSLYQSCLEDLEALKVTSGEQEKLRQYEYEKYIAQNDELAARVWMQTTQCCQQNEDFNDDNSNDIQKRQEILEGLLESVGQLKSRMGQVIEKGNELYEDLSESIKKKLGKKPPELLYKELSDAALCAYEGICDVYFDIASIENLEREQKKELFEIALIYCDNYISLFSTNNDLSSNNDMEETRANIEEKIKGLADKPAADVSEQNVLRVSEAEISSVDSDATTETENNEGAEEEFEKIAQNELDLGSLGEFKTKIMDKIALIKSKDPNQVDDLAKDAGYLYKASQVGHRMSRDNEFKNAEIYFDLMKNITNNINNIKVYVVAIPLLNPYYQKFFTNCVEKACETEFPITALNQLDKAFQDLGYEANEEKFWHEIAVNASDKLLTDEISEDVSSLRQFDENIQIVIDFCADHQFYSEVLPGKIDALRVKRQDEAKTIISNRVNELLKKSSESGKSFMFFENLANTLSNLKEEADYFGIHDEEFKVLFTKASDQLQTMGTKSASVELKIIAETRIFTDSETIPTKVCESTLTYCQRIFENKVTCYSNEITDYEILVNLLKAIRDKGESYNRDIVPYLTTLSEKYKQMVNACIDDVLRTREEAVYPTAELLKTHLEPFTKNLGELLNLDDGAMIPDLAKNCLTYAVELHLFLKCETILPLMKQVLKRVEDGSQGEAWFIQAVNYIQQSYESASKRTRNSTSDKFFTDKNSNKRRRVNETLGEDLDSSGTLKPSILS